MSKTKKKPIDTFVDAPLSDDVGAKKMLSEMEQHLKEIRHNLVDDMYRQFAMQLEYEKLRKEVERMNQFYNTCVLMCVFHPLKKGVSSNSILKSIGFYAACCLFSKTFREDVKSVADDVLYPVIKRKAEKQPDSVWAKRKRRVEQADADGHLTVTPETLSMVRVALCEKTYDEMRLHQNHVREILAQYRETEELLYRLGYENGISRDVLDEYTKNVVTELLEANPSDVKYFSELAYGDVVRSEDGKYCYKNGMEFPYAFTPRRPESVNNIRIELSKAWDDIMHESLTMESWRSAVFSEKTRQMQSNFLDYICDDNQVNRKVYNENQAVYVSGQENTCWMTDYCGPDPFYEDGIKQSYDAYMEHGPQHVEKFVADDVPEFKSALGRWLNQHTEYAPAVYQRKMNELYLEAENKTDVADEIAELCAKRNQLMEQWQCMMDEFFIVKTSDLYEESESSQKIGYAVKDATIQTASTDGLTYERLNMLTASFGSLTQYDEQGHRQMPTMDVPDFLL